MKTFSKPFSKLASLLLIVSSSVFASEAELANTTFSESSVLLFCEAPNSDSEQHTQVFLDAFPKLIANMTKVANEGGLERAHYLGNLNDGFFLVFRGDTLELAQAKADELVAQNDAIIKEALASADIEADSPFSDSCKAFKIGPVAVVPTK